MLWSLTEIAIYFAYFLIMTIFYEDVQFLGNMVGYQGWMASSAVLGSNGQDEILRCVWVEVRFVEPTSLVPWSSWIHEIAVLRRLTPGTIRLSGVNMRRHFRSRIVVLKIDSCALYFVIAKIEVMKI
jgi:hypothetical protein